MNEVEESICSSNFIFVVFVNEARPINISSFFYKASNKLHSLEACTLNRQSQFIIRHVDKDNKLQTRPSFAISYHVLIFPVYVDYNTYICLLYTSDAADE